MRNYFLLLLLVFFNICFSQQFEKNWEKVLELEAEGKTKSAFEETQKIYAKAKRKKDETQIIKTFFYNSKYIQTLEEEAQLKILSNLKKEMKDVGEASRSILQYIYAKCLESHLAKNRYQIQQFTAIDSIGTEDFRTWPVNILEKEIKTAYNYSIQKEEILKKTPLLDYELIFDFEKYEDFKETSLFDFLVSEVANYYSARIRHHEIKHSDLELKKDLFFDVSPNYQKSSFDFITEENLRQYLILHQKLESGSKKTQEHQFRRLQFLKNTFFYSDNDYYLKVLTRFQKTHLYNEILQKVLLEKAHIFRDSASKEKKPQNNLLAVATYDSILNLSRSPIYKIAQKEKAEITRKNLNVQLLKEIYNNEQTRAHVDYKNTDNLIISFYKVNHAFLSDQNLSYSTKDSLVRNIVKEKTPIKRSKYKLENKKDFFSYSTEVLVPQLETGHYLAYFESENKNDSLNKTVDGFETITVSNLSLFSYEKDKKIFFKVHDRKTGLPLEEVQIKSDQFKLYTDELGSAFSTKIKERYYDNYDLLLTKGNDTLAIENSHIDSLTNDSKYQKKIEPKIEFYLDRAIYRPGQTVLYKGIAFWRKNGQVEVVPNLTANIILQDANEHHVTEIEIKTNEFGSFSGEFVLPKNGLTGEFKIIAEEPEKPENDPMYNTKEDKHPFWDNLEYENPKISFQVEEYKRPKFEITFNPIKETYMVNNPVTVTGNAKAFSGSSISDAKVSYTITRESYRKYRSYPDDSEVIAQKETKTDGTGKFSIDFTATPNERFSKEDLPVFAYKVSVSITDNNGETRKNETMLKAGYHTLVLDVSLPKKIETDKKETIYVRSENLNNEFVPVKGELKFYYLGPIENKWKKSLFGVPDIKTIDNSEFEKLFPYEQMTDKSEVNGKLYFSKSITTEKNKPIPLDFVSYWKTGGYKVVFTAKDAYGNPVEDSFGFRLFQSKDKQIPSNELFTIKQLNSNPKKDGYVNLEISSNFADLYIYADAFYNNRIYDSNVITLTDKKAVLQFPVKKDFKTGIFIEFHSIFENTAFNKGMTVLFHEEEPKLQLELETLRNKIEPGSKENWSFKVKGKQKEEAEVLASMYDLSLDQFTVKNWNPLNFEMYYNNYGQNYTKLGFNRIYSTLDYENPYYEYYNVREEKTQLIWFGFNFSNAKDYYTQLQYKKLKDAKKEKLPSTVKSVSGIVTEGGLPLPGASVTVKGTSRGTQTDMDGYYSIDAAPGEKLVFMFIGMKDCVIKVNSKVHNVAMASESTTLENVVVTAVGIKKRQDEITSSYEDNKVYSGTENFYSVGTLAGKVEGLQVIPGNANSKTKIVLRGNRSISGENQALIVIDGVVSDADALTKIPVSELVSTTILKGAQGTALYGDAGVNGVIVVTTKKALTELTQVQTRKNFNETAFFYPSLKTDSNGRIKFSFTSPEALTQWKLRLLAHTKKGVSGYYENTVVTQKDFMVTPNFPRFFREKDTVYISVKLANMTYEAKAGVASLQLFDAATMQPIDSKVANSDNIKNFTITAKGNSVVTWRLVIPEGLQGVQYKVLAKSGNFSDGEENIVPIVTNSMLVTESIPLWVRENSKKEYVFENMKNNTSPTLKNHLLTLEYTSNPTWLAIQSLPYLMEYEHDCAEQTFARLYGNALATTIINSNPKLAEVFESWKKDGNLTSKLEQNEELKSLILAETPWLLDSKSDEEKKKTLALLLDLNKMKASLDNTFQKLKAKQTASGGFPWFSGMEENSYITNHILAGLGHLEKLKIDSKTSQQFDEIAKTAVPFVDNKFITAHNTRIEKLKDPEKLVWLQYYNELHYLYARSFYLNKYPLSETLQKASRFYIERCKKDWLTYSLYEKGMTALTLYRFGETKTAKDILTHLKETSANNDEIGMYWLENKSGWYWYNAPIETQALLIEAFAEIENDTKSADAMKVWLLKSRQNTNWPSTKATTEAVYALLMQGTDWLSVKDNTVIKMGATEIATKKMKETEKEAETGYFKMTWKADEIKKEMATLSIENKSKVTGYGGYFWQYFEDLDNIKTFKGGPMSVEKELYLNKNTDDGKQLQHITTKNPLKIGDLVTVRLIIKVTEDMEYIHLKDMRAAGFEPIEVISQHNWKNGLSYYQSTKDLATHFFFDRINKGTYVLEYDVRVNNKGEFSNGITTIQSMYAPEFTSHTKGIRVSIKE
ncbi:MAG TPA: alpha-2-macroglobulin family protein [Flavobacterium sp.]|uniref:alpha-2-macroglobulin family protein n=1 Tax=Flavobacterium sp. TaxID=239 RepID=UPI002C7A2BD6|nr:alpha-2-macroglobulin family protein [Flavobacterium sp.]HSD14830.1 alpha-2-macroglobulin family protein [Flavobacterium sp.]